MKEKFFGPRNIGLVLPQPGPGYLTSMKSEDAAEPIFAGGRFLGAGTSLWWTPSTDETVVEHARAAARDTAAEVVTDGSENDEAGLGLAVAEHLAQHRGTGATVGPCSLERLPTLPGTVRLPHLVHAETSHGEQGRTVFELLPEADADRWLGLPVQHADLAFFEAHLPQLLDLKRRSRTPCGLQDTAAEKQLRELLDERGRYLSIRFVLQHATHIKILIREALVR